VAVVLGLFFFVLALLPARGTGGLLSLALALLGFLLLLLLFFEFLFLLLFFLDLVFFRLNLQHLLHFEHVSRALILLALQEALGEVSDRMRDRLEAFQNLFQKFGLVDPALGVAPLVFGPEEQKLQLKSVILLNRTVQLFGLPALKFFQRVDNLVLLIVITGPNLHHTQGQLRHLRNRFGVISIDDNRRQMIRDFLVITATVLESQAHDGANLLVLLFVALVLLAEVDVEVF